MTQVNLTPQSADLEYDADQLCQALSQRCELLCCEVHSFTGRFKIDGAKVVISEAELDEDVATRSSWRILPDDWSKRISTISNKARRIIRKKGLPFRNGVYLVRHEDLPEIIEKLQGLQAEYREMATELANNWDEVLEKIQARIRSQFSESTLSDFYVAWSTLQKKIPQRETLQQRFNIVFATWAIGGGSNNIELMASLRQLNKLADDANVDQMVASNLDFIQLRNGLQEMQSSLTAGPRTNLEVAGMSQQMVNSLRNSSRQLMEDCLERAFAEPRQELLVLVQGLISRLESGDQIHSSTVNAIRRAWNKLQAFSWLGTQELEEKLNRGMQLLSEVEAVQADRSKEAADRLLQAVRDSANTIQEARTSRRFIEV